MKQGLSRRFTRALAVGVAWATAVAGASTVALVVTSTPASALTIVVGNGGDAAVNPADCAGGTPANCSLRDAFARAADNATNAGPDTINVDNALTTINLTTRLTQGDATGDVTVDGGNGVAITQTAANNTGVISWGGTTLTLSNLSVTGGKGIGGTGVATTSGASLVLNNADVHHNNATTSAKGAGVDVGGTLTVTDSSIRDNGIVTGTGDFIAGGAFANTSATITGSTIANNTGGGTVSIANAGGVLTVGTISVTDSTIESNSVSGASGSTVTGGLAAQGNLTVQRSTFKGNSATSTSTANASAAAGTNDALSLINSTLTQNTASSTSGFKAIAAAANGVSVTHVTARTNTTAGSTLRSHTAGISLFGSTITATSGGTSCSSGGLPGSITSLGYNHTDEGIAGSCVQVVPVVGDQTSGDPLLAALGSHGGPTKTMPPQAGSPLIDAIPNASCSVVVTIDQRLFPRPLPNPAGNCDIGAAEGPTVPTAPAIGAAFAGSSSATVNWTPTTSNGGSAITGYTATASPSGNTCTQPGANNTACAVGSLPPGIPQTFTVKAENALGSSAASAPSNAVTPFTTPNQPAPPTAVAGPQSATVSWVAPANGFSPITGYVVTGTPGGTCSVGGTTTSCVVPGLTANQSHTFVVRAVNAAGASLDSNPSNAVTPFVPTYRPDAMAGKSPTTAVTGANKYYPNYINQTVSTNQKRNTTATFYFRVQNDGNSIDRFKIKGTGSTAGKFTVNYYQGVASKTTPVTSVAGYLTAFVQPNAFATIIRVTVKVSSTATLNSTKTLNIDVFSNAQAAKRDRVVLKVKAV